MDEFIVQLIARLDSSKTVDDVKKIEKELNAKGIQLKPIIDLAGSKQEIQNFAKQLQSILSTQGLDIDTSKILSSINQVVKEVNSITSKANKIQLSIDNGHGVSSYQNQINGLINDFQRYGVLAKEVETITSNLQTTFNNMKNMSGQELVNQADKFEQEFKAVKISVDQAKLAYDKFAQPVSQEKVSSLIIRINNFLSKNTKIIEEARQKLEAYVQELSLGNVSLTKYNEINLALKETDSNMRTLGRLGKSLKDQISQAASSFTQWISVSSVIMTLVYQLKRIPEEVVKVNSSLIELSKVSDASSVQIANYFDDAAESAKRLGSSISDVINATADFSRLGYNLPDASELANIATLYKNVGDGIDIDEASSSIVSTMKAFKINAEDAISIVDRFNEVGNNFAISSGGIGDALSRSASSLSVANNTLSESIGLITAANTVVQDTSVVGTALKTVSLRMTSTSAELEELGEDTEYACETLSDYRDLVMGLTHNKVDIIGDNGEYKSTFQMLQEISKVWQDMNSMEQSSLMKALFGVRQANVGSSILENFQIAEEAMKSAENSAGSALKEQEEYAKGIQYSLDVVGAKFQELANHVLDSSFLKGIVDTGGNAISVLDTIIDKVGMLPTLMSAIGAGFGAKTSLDYRKYDITHILQGSGKSYCYG